MEAYSADIANRVPNLAQGTMLTAWGTNDAATPPAHRHGPRRLRRSLLIMPLWLRRLGAWAWHSAWLLLAAAALFWAGNAIVGRAARGDIPPIALSFWRWCGAFCIVIGIAWPHLKRDMPILIQHRWIVLALSAVGIAAFNTIYYFGLTKTTALNGLLLQSAMPLVILMWDVALFRDRPAAKQWIGVLISLSGVLAITVHGQIADLLALSLNAGDGLILLAIAIYSLYSSLLRRRPKVHPLSFLAASFALGSLMLLPFYGWALLDGARIHGGIGSYLAIFYTMVFPSFIAYLCFNRGVELIGAARAGPFMHLVPVFGSILAVLLLGESFRPYHAAGIGLIGAGIAMASRRR
jgi:drug/metabolite transporter (DMT)-like permease